MFGLFKSKETKEAIPSPAMENPATPVVLQAPYELKIKQVSLGLEIRLIKNNEKRLERRRAKTVVRLGQTKETMESMEAGNYRRWQLENKLKTHRAELSVEARATNLARGFLKGRPYSSIENKCHEANDPFGALDRASEIVKKWGMGDQRFLAQAFEQWEQDAKSYFEACKIPPLSVAHQGQRHLLRLLKRGEQLSLTPEEREEEKRIWLAAVKKAITMTTIGTEGL